MESIYLLNLLLVLLRYCVASSGPNGGNDASRKSNSTRRIPSLPFDRFLQTNPRGRNIKAAVASCNQVVDTLNLTMLSELLGNAIDSAVAPGSAENSFLRTSFLAKLSHGVEIRRICAGCSNVTLDSPVFQDYCGPHVYGSAAQFSGLLMVPLTESNEKLPGTLKGVIDMHVSTLTQIPSISWGADNPNNITLLFDAAIASTGVIVIAPDYMGYGESAEIYKAYVVRKSYATSVVPLWFWTNRMLAEETHCTTNLGGGALLMGYSEGGYASVAVADALHQLGVDIFRVESGGGPYRVARSILGIVQNIDAGIFLTRRRYILAMIGSAYSSTYSGIANFNRSQNLLAVEKRNLFVNLLNASASENGVNQEIPTSDILSIFDARLVDFARNAIAEGNFEPCSNTTVLSQFEFLCEALKENDLTKTLENVVYPVDVCQSPDDDLVVYENVPNFTANPLLSYIPASGTHNDAAIQCLLVALLVAVGEEFHAYAPPNTQSNGGCSSLYQPTKSPSFHRQEPTHRPTFKNATSQSGLKVSGGPQRKASTIRIFVGGAIFYAIFVSL